MGQASQLRHDTTVHHSAAQARNLWVMSALPLPPATHIQTISKPCLTCRVHRWPSPLTSLVNSCLPHLPITLIPILQPSWITSLLCSKSLQWFSMAETSLHNAQRALPDLPAHHGLPSPYPRNIIPATPTSMPSLKHTIHTPLSHLRKNDPSCLEHYSLDPHS